MNYGNRLQNYALQYFLFKSDCKSCTVFTSKKHKNFCYYIAQKIKSQIKRLVIYNNYTNFDYFEGKIHKTSYCEYIDTKTHNIGNYDAIIVGSDQVWNTTFDFVSVNSFLPFPHPRKIAFSASFGVDAIPYDQRIVDCLNDFKAISVREEAGAKIVEELTGREATVLVDPTMLLTKEEWRKVAKKPKGAREGFILTYFLSPKCEASKEKLDEIRDGREVYELLNDADKVAGTAGPSEFLWLFDHADLILTDSFHACVFSFLFNKPFVVYDRNWNERNMNSRLETLLSKFHLERKYAGSGLENDIWEHDYEEGYKQLEIEREKAIGFLKKALED